MEDIQIDNKLISTYYSKSGNLNYKLVKNITEEDINYINNRFEYIESIKEGLFRLKYNINIRPICKICGNNVKFCGTIKRPYSDCCCQECANKYRQIKIKETAILRYGVDHPAKTKQSIQKHKEYYHKNNIKEKLHNAVKEKYSVDNVFQLDFVKEKINNTSLNKYGTKWPNQSNKVKNKIKETNKEKYGVNYGFQSPIIKEKIKQTNLINYGVDNPVKSEIIKEKIKETNLVKYGNEHHIASNIVKEKIKETCLEKYGVDCILKSPEINKKIKQINLKKYGKEYYMQTNKFKENISKLLKEKYLVDYDEIINKRINTNLHKYNKEFHTQTDEFKYNMSILMSSTKMRERIYNTHKKNNSFKQSKEEDKIYEIIVKKFPNTIRQYKSIEYPFNCDFYIPNLNLYIEYNGTWTHGNHPFNENNIEDVKLINKWKEKNTKYYNGAIYNWTILDIIKRNTAKEHNLNYKELWNMKEALEYINNL